jgi:SPP1 gp7 family putative phage head morphogenesis protein
MARTKKDDKAWNLMQLSLLDRLATHEQTMQRRMSDYYLSEAARLDKEIGAFYQKYGNNNVIQFRNLMLRMNKADRQLLMRNCDAFIKKYPQYANLLPVRENIYKLNRLEGLQASLRVQQLNIGVYESKQIEQHLKTVGAEAFEETSRLLGHEYNPEIVKKFVDGLTITDTTENTIANKRKLADYLSSDIAQGIARGDSYKRLSDSVTARFKKVSKRDMDRLVYTQGTLVYNEATAGVVEEDFDSYKISTARDNRVCKICKALEGQVLPFEFRMPGVNFPPLHPWCRCSFEVVITDRQKWIDDYVKKHSGTKEDAEKIIERV